MIWSYHCRFDDFEDTKRDKDSRRVLLAVAIVEFIVTFSAVIFTCQFVCFDRSDCCYADSQQGNINPEIEENSLAACMQSENTYLKTLAFC